MSAELTGEKSIESGLTDSDLEQVSGGTSAPYDQFISQPSEDTVHKSGPEDHWFE